MRFDHKSYGARIRQLRIRKGFTQEQLAEKLNVSGSSSLCRSLGTGANNFNNRNIIPLENLR